MTTSTTSDLAERALGSLNASRVRAEADLRHLKAHPPLSVIPDKALKHDRTIANAAEQAAAGEAEVEELTRQLADLEASEAEPEPWHRRMLSWLPSRKKARAAKVAAVAAARDHLEIRAGNAQAWKNIKAHFTQARAEVIAEQEVADAKAHAEAVQALERHITDLRAGVEMVRADPVTAVEARADLSTVLREWRERVGAAAVVHEPP